MKLIRLSALLLLVCSASAQVPSVVSYQGRVQVGGTNFSGIGQFKFALVSPGTNVSRQATAVASVTSGFITGITVTDGGGGYTSAPAVIIVDSTGSGARAVAQVSGGVVTNLAVQNAGNGYSASPIVTIESPPVTIVHGTFWSNDGTSSGGGEPTTAVPIPVQQGLFTVFLGDTNLPNMQPVPAAVFTQSGVHLRIWFNDGTSGFAQLTPDQRIGSVAYAMIASRVTESGVVSGSALTEGSVSSAKIENGTILIEDLSTSLLNGAFWNLRGNNGTTPGTHFLGTTDNQSLELKVNSTRALRLEPTGSNDTVNVVGGSVRNFVAAGVVGATISGGGSGNYFGLAYSNSVRSHFGTVSGGFGNLIETNAGWSTIGGGESNNIAGGPIVIDSVPNSHSTIAGGTLNKIGARSAYSTISGGRFNDIGLSSPNNAISGGQDNNIQGAANTIGGGFANDINPGSSCVIAGGENNRIFASSSATIAGGRQNNISTNSNDSTIGGGESNGIGVGSEDSAIAGGEANRIGSNSDGSTIGGGRNNTIGNNASFATIPGGQINFATTNAFAAGYFALANHRGAFVWGDSTGNPIASTNANSVTFKAAGGYRLFSNSAASQGVFLAPSGGSWASISDRNAKENFEPVNARAVLDKVADLPLSTWNYKSQTNGIRHIGPMAQDFKAAFGVGETDTGITTVDADGVALAAIQGLNQKLQEELSRRDAENADLKRRIQALESIILNQKSH